ncbi:ethylene response sensor 2 [Hibiscus syriacus]|uniref:Ethylene response sensor 2 n=1 Tax=Hibiscus syriacus TaxID=106335 RepID=A0A6A3BU58_HIBSY|nr:ethylene response sensor 2 [Hibiscus syriacus]
MTVPPAGYVPAHPVPYHPGANKMAVLRSYGLVPMCCFDALNVSMLHRNPIVTILGLQDAPNVSVLDRNPIVTILGLQIVYLLVSAPLLYDFYIYGPKEPRYSVLLGDFLQSVAQCGAFFFFWGMKNSISGRQLRKKIPRPKTA